MPPESSALAKVTRLLPRRSDYAGLSNSWRGDVVAGVTVSVVALPLALAFGITTGLGATAGLITAIVAGFVAGIFGSSRPWERSTSSPMRIICSPISMPRSPTRGCTSPARRRSDGPAARRGVTA